MKVHVYTEQIECFHILASWKPMQTLTEKNIDKRIAVFARGEILIQNNQTLYDIVLISHKIIIEVLISISPPRSLPSIYCRLQTYISPRDCVYIIL